MKFGVNILNFGAGASAEALLRWAQLAEALGYHSVWISDHVAVTPRVAERYPEPYYDTFAALAWLAGQTKRVILGNTVAVLPLRHPILTARLVANIDQFSGGRFVFGVGVGAFEDEYVALGLEFKRRGRLTDETLAACQALWSGRERVSYEGRLIKFAEIAAIETRQKPWPPVWVGGGSDAALQRTLRFGDAWHPLIFNAAATKESLAKLHKLAAEAGKPSPTFAPRIRLDIRDAPLGDDRRMGAGSVEQVRADLAELASWGAEHIVLDWFTGDPALTANHEHGWQMFATLAERVVDLDRETLR